MINKIDLNWKMVNSAYNKQHFSSTELESARQIVLRFKNKENLQINEDDLWRAKTLYSSAFHPDTGEKMFLPGRMCAQV